MAISNLLTGRVRVVSPKNVTQDRYQFIDLSQVEPNFLELVVNSPFVWDEKLGSSITESIKIFKQIINGK